MMKRSLKIVPHAMPRRGMTGQLSNADGVRLFCFGATGLLALAATVAVLYLVKSALGINLLPGPSPLHGLLYHLVR